MIMVIITIAAINITIAIQYSGVVTEKDTVLYSNISEYPKP